MSCPPRHMDHVALVTGSTSGIGHAVATALARKGCRIAMHGLGDPAVVELMRREIQDECGVPIRHWGTDLRDPVAIERMITEIKETLGPITILVNNAGVQHVAPIDEFPVEKWDLIMSVNLSAVFHCTRLVVPMMKEAGWGRVINIASTHGVVASRFKSAYVAAKHGVLGMTKSVALELAETNITCNSICPGYVNTPLVQMQVDQQAEAHKMHREEVIQKVILASQPSKRFIEVEEVADLVLFLSSDSAKSMTGGQYLMDGGWTAQ